MGYSFVTFDCYGVIGGTVTVALQRITHFWPIEFSGKPGVEISLDTGVTVYVAGSVDQVKAQIGAAVEAHVFANADRSDR